MSLSLSRTRGISTIQPGDVIGFSACNPKGTLIRVCTGGLICRGGLSHVGIAVHWPGYRRPLVCESTSLCPEPCVVRREMVKGVQLHRLRTRILAYPGHVWHYPLVEGLSAANSTVLTLVCRSYLGIRYDRAGAIGARHTLLARLLQRPEDLSTLFCSEWVAACLRHVGKLKTDNASAWSPNGLVRYLVRHGVCRKPVRIK